MRVLRRLGHWVIVALLAAMVFAAVAIIGGAVHGHSPVSCYETVNGAGCIWK